MKSDIKTKIDKLLYGGKPTKRQIKKTNQKNLKKEIDLLKFMRLIILSAFFCLVTTQCWSESIPENTAGLLLGLRTATNNSEEGEGPEKPIRYRTLWIRSVSGKIRTLTGSGIIVPYGKKFWKIKNGYFTKEVANEMGDFTTQIEYLRANPLGKPVSVNSALQTYGQEMMGGWSYVGEKAKLMFVGNCYVGIERNNHYSSGGSYRPDFDTLEVREIKDINRVFRAEEPDGSLEPEKCVSVKRVFGDSVSPYLQKYQARKAEEQSEVEPKITVTNITDEYGWGLKRRNARWIPQLAVKWYANWSWSSAEKYELEELPLALPSQLMAYNNAACDFSQIKKAVLNAKDAFVAPDRTLSVVFTPGKLLIYRGENFQNPAAVVKLGSTETPIMSEWALGSYASQWTSVLKSYLKAYQYQ
jgi:hypothetical protein